MRKCVAKGLKIGTVLLCCCVLNVGCGVQRTYREDRTEEVIGGELADDGQGNSDDDAKTIETDYQSYSGFWSEGGISHEELLRDGGIEFYVEITDQNELSGWIYAQQGGTERFAEIDGISCSIKDGQCVWPFTDDGWGNSGTLHIQLKQDAIGITVEDFILSDENLSGYGISGTYTLTRSSLTQVSDLQEQTQPLGAPDLENQSEALEASDMEAQSELPEQYSADWSEEHLLREIGKRGRYREYCSFYSEWLDYMENVREVRDISMYVEPLYATDTIVCSREDFEDVPPLILHLAKNEIYARHGYIFKDTDLYNYFMMLVWYLPEVTPEEFDDSVFNEAERHNLDLLKELDTYERVVLTP
ncbi:MAG: YARHG domain-containing protein [Lachnospiraceae bacterium]|nr:YARHG domain-containing protein [Lachnospiraceae bacterium]